MASLEKRGRVFRVAFRYQGVKYSRSLHTHDQGAAAGCLSRLEDNLHRLELGTLEAPQGTDLVSYLLSDGRVKRERSPEAVVPAPCPEALTLRALFDEYFRNLPEGNLEATTVSGMKIHQRQLERRFSRDCLVNSLTLTSLQGYIEKRSRDKGLHGRNVTPTTIRKAIVTLRTVWNWGRQHGIIDKPFPSRGLKYPKGTEKPPFMTFAEVERRSRKASPAEAADLWECVFLSLREIEELLALAKERARLPFVYPMFVFGAHTGARRSEMVRSKWSDIDFHDNLITVHERKKSHDKRTTRRVPMSPLLRQVLLAWQSEHPVGEWVFCHNAVVPWSKRRRAVGEALTPDEAYDHFKRTLQGSKWCRLRGWHVFRHSFCSNCAARGIDQRIIDAWAGHLSEDMVRRYRHLLPDQHQSAIVAVFG